VNVDKIELQMKVSSIYKVWGKSCAYCGIRLSIDGEKQRTVDHFIPKYHGGKDRWNNVVLSCVQCNKDKGHTMPEVYLSTDKYKEIKQRLDNVFKKSQR